MDKTTFALYFGNRGFFPASLIAGARAEMKCELNALGHSLGFDIAVPQNEMVTGL